MSSCGVGGVGRRGGGDGGHGGHGGHGVQLVEYRVGETPRASTACWDIQEDGEESSGSDINIEKTVQCDFIIKYNKTSKVVKKYHREKVNVEDIMKNKDKHNENVIKELCEKREDSSEKGSVNESKNGLIFDRNVICLEK